ncbi:MAG: serine/threonine protein kinase [Nannocystaceae bacterium]|nr:serine/threonine protein kinase [Nannocystaceae bacterium]
MTGSPTDIDSDRVEPPSGDRMEARRMRQRIAERMFNEASEPVRVGRFELIESIGSGGMGVVFSARDHRLERRVAIKILHDFTADRIGRERLLQEAKALAQVSHPNVVQVFEVGEHEGRVYVAMEYVQGSSLRQWRIRGERPWAEVLSLYMDAAKGLVAVHEAGLVHRDFKPANVMLGDDGRVRVADFGLARTPLTEDSAGGLASAPSHTVTIEGRVAGTPAHMPPEQRLGGEVDVRSDQFAWCTCVWEGLFGSRPYDDVSPSRSHAPVLPAPPSGLVPSYVVDVLRRGLSWDPAGRWPDMRALLDAFAKGSRRRSAGRGVLLVGMVGILAAAGGAWLARPDRCAAPTEAIAAIWSLGTAQALTSGLHANAPEFATKAAHAAAHRFDTFADQWLATHVEVCEAATELRRTSPVRRQLVEACLEQRLQRFGTMVDALTPMSAANAVGADRLTTSLRTPMECLKLKPELLNAAPSPRGEEIARAHALLELGSTAAAAQLAQRISEEVEDADPQGQAEAELIVGRAHAELGEGRKAAKHLLRAIDVGEAAGSTFSLRARGSRSQLSARYDSRISHWPRRGPPEPPLRGDASAPHMSWAPVCLSPRRRSRCSGATRSKPGVHSTAPPRMQPRWQNGGPHYGSVCKSCAVTPKRTQAISQRPERRTRRAVPRSETA